MESRDCSRGCSPGEGHGCSSLVRQAAWDGSPEAADALAKVCESCWKPVYAWIRRQGYGVEDAEDLTQAYFTRFLEKRFVAQYRPGTSGCFRPFLLVSVRSFVSNERDRERARKRGGGRPPLSFDAPRDDRSAAREPADAHTPETHLERTQSRGRLAAALELLRAEQSGCPRSQRFRSLYPHLVDDPEAAPYRRIAEDWGTSASAVRVAVHRLRLRLRAILEEQPEPPSRPAPDRGTRSARRRTDRFLRRVAALLLVTLLGLSPGGALAGEPGPPDAGPRVRVTLAGSGDRVVGRLLSSDDAVLVLGRGRGDSQKAVEVPRFDVAHLEVSERRSRKALGLGIGVLVGSGVALAVGQSQGQECDGRTGLFANLCFSKSDTSLMAGILTVPIGALVGWLVAPGERWRSESLSAFAATVGPAPGGGVEARVALSF